MLWMSSIAAMITMQLRMLLTRVWLYEETGSGLQLGLLGVVQLAVQLPAILYGGTLADEVDRKKLMAATQAVSVIFIGVMTVLVYFDSLVPWHIYAVTAILGVSSVLGNPARSALTANVVPRTHLMHAVTTNTATMQIGSVIAPLLFSIIILAFGIEPTFALTACVAIPSVLLPMLIRTPARPVQQGPKQSVLRRTWDGFLYVKSHPILPGLYILDIGVTICSYYREILPLLADRMFRGGPAAVGVLQAANSVGGIAGSFLVLFLAKFRSKGMLVIYATLIYALLLIVFGFTTSLILGVVIITGLGAADAVTMTTRQTTVQLTTPDNMRGRAVSFHSVSAMSANNLGTLEVGLMSEAIGAGETLILGGVIAIFVTLIIWRALKGIREYRYP
jgi:predicted MFS family arabinose efflux permease